MESEIQKFFENKTVFLTGASGFLGKVILEKLLRATEVKRIFVLLRPKRGKDIQDRIADWKSSPLFELLLKSKPDAFERIVVTAGDCKEPDLGISPADRELLVQQVEVVMHSAATVRFVEPLHVALDINTRATRLMLQMAKQMPRLVSFVYISTAFSNCVIHHITERFYPEHLTCGADKVLAMRETLETDLFDRMAPTLLGEYPNTYTYTKALAEQLLQTEAGDLPVCVFRPGSIVATNKEPFSGWVDNIYGPLAILYRVSFGILRIGNINRNAEASIVPVDSCANLVLANAWRTAVEATQRGKQQQAVAPPPTIYNYVTSGKNVIRHKNLVAALEYVRDEFPISQSIWYPFLHTTTTYWLFKFATIFYHVLPAYIFDLVLRLRGQKPFMIEMYKKVHKSLDTTHKFMTENWSFDTPNTNRLWLDMSAADQELFHFDLNTLDWPSYLIRALFGMRTYLAKEDTSEEAINRSKQKAKRLRNFHRLVQFTLCCIGIAFLRWFFYLFL